MFKSFTKQFIKMSKLNSHGRGSSYSFIFKPDAIANESNPL